MTDAARSVRHILLAAVVAWMVAPGAGQARQEPNAAAGTWRFLGPSDLGGPVTSILPDPADPNTLLIGTLGGGIWRTTDAGQHWSPVDDNLPSLFISAMARDPANADNVYAATGKDSSISGGERLGAWMLRSRDRGLTWVRTRTAASPAPGPRRLTVSSDGTIQLAPVRSIFRTTDGWDNFTSSSFLQAYDVAFNPAIASEAVAVVNVGGASQPIVLSTDGGQTWPVQKDLFCSYAAIGYAPSSPSVVYAVCAGPSSADVWRSANGGRAWTQVSTLTIRAPRPGRSSGDDTIALWVDPTDPNRLLVGGLDLWRSADGGSTFTRISDSTNSASMHGHIRAIAAATGFNGAGSRQMYVGTDGGIFRTNDIATAGTTSWQALNHGLGASAFMAADGHGSSGLMIALTQNNEVVRFDPSTSAWGITATPADGPRAADFSSLGHLVDVDPSNANYVYTTDVDLRLLRSADGGRTFASIAGPALPMTCTLAAGDCSPRNAPFALDRRFPAVRMFVVANPGLYRTGNIRDSAPGWEDIGPTGNTADTTARTLAVDPADGNEVWVSRNSAVRASRYHSGNATINATWSLQSQTEPFTRIAFARFQVLYLTQRDGIYRGGRTGFESAPRAQLTPSATTIVAHPYDRDWVFAGTEAGVFESQDGGLTWVRNSPNTAGIEEFFWMNRTLVAVTRGRGLWAYDAPSSPLLHVDEPAAGAAATEPFQFSGWAIDRSAPHGSGIEAVHVYAFPAAGGAPVFVGVADYGIARPDIGAAYGSTFTNCGFQVKVRGLAPGSYQLVAYGLSAMNFQSAPIARAVTVVTVPPRVMIDNPSTSSVSSAFLVRGWAVDLAAATNPGIESVHVYAYANGGAGPAVFLGSATLGFPRTDIRAAFGSQFLSAGYELQASGLQPGGYLLVVFAQSALGGAVASSSTTITVVGPFSDPRMSLDGPTAGQQVSQPFVTGGWAIDRGATTGSGVDAIHVWAFPVNSDGSIGAGRFVDQATLNGGRPDVAAVYGPQFQNSGFNFLMTGLTPGEYIIGVYAHSGVSGTFNPDNPGQTKFVRITVVGSPGP